MQKSRGITAAVLVGFVSSAFADVGVYTGSGQNLRQISTEKIALDKIDVTIVPCRGPCLFDGGVQGLDSIEFRCEFVLVNLEDKPCTLQVGFPVDTQFVDPPHFWETKPDSNDWVSEYSFMVRDEHSTYHVEFVWRAPQLGPDATPKPGTNQWVFSWKVAFDANEKKLLKVQYRLPMSMTLASTSKRGMFADPVEVDPSWLAGFIGNGLVEFGRYVTQTGATWAGKVREARFTLVTKSFERYLTERPITEGALSDRLLGKDTSTQAEGLHSHTQWFRHILPADFTEVPEGIRWTYHDYEPGKPIEFRYYLTFFPALAKDVDPWFDAVVTSMKRGAVKKEDVPLLRQALLATYGQVPSDERVRKFVEDQVWYEPNKDFDASKLSAERKAILLRLDTRLRALMKTDSNSK